MQPTKTYCVVVWRWTKTSSIRDAFIEKVIGPFINRYAANRLAQKLEKQDRTAANTFTLKPTADEASA